MAELAFLLAVYLFGAAVYLTLIVVSGGFEALRAKGLSYALVITLAATLAWPYWALEFPRKK